MHIHPFRIFTIYLIAIFFAFLNLSGIKIKAIADFLPLFDVMIIYYFAVLKPNLLPVWLLFLLGLVSDALNGFPLGITSLIYIIVVKIFITLDQKKAEKENFKQILQQFSFFAFSILLAKWALLSIYHFKIYNFYPPLLQLAITVALYVVMHRLFDYLNKILLGGYFDS